MARAAAYQRYGPTEGGAFHGYLITPHGFGRKGFFITKDGATIHRHVDTMQQAKTIISLLAGWRNPRGLRRASAKEVMARYTPVQIERALVRLGVSPSAARAAVAKDNPRSVWMWPRTLQTFATLAAARAHAQEIRGTRGAFLSHLSDGRYGVTTFADARKRGWL